MKKLIWQHDISNLIEEELLKRRGKFTISMELYKAGYLDIIIRILEEVFIVEKIFNINIPGYEYTALSKHFRRINKGEQIPRYIATGLAGSDKVTWKEIT